jgi:hypothetical protein
MSKSIMRIMLCGLVFLVACKSEKKKDPLAEYVSKEENGLTRKIRSENIEIVSQLIPEKEDNNVYKFMVYVNTTPEKMTDSVLYFFNYKSSDYFRLISGADTLQPVLSERIANGRRESNQFTVLFDMNGKELQSPVSMVFLGNKLFQDSLAFHYELNDIKKASKSLYGYE